jgi:hypothetical protein
MDAVQRLNGGGFHCVTICEAQRILTQSAFVRPRHDLSSLGLAIANVELKIQSGRPEMVCSVEAIKQCRTLCSSGLNRLLSIVVQDTTRVVMRLSSRDVRCDFNGFNGRDHNGR